MKRTQVNSGPVAAAGTAGGPDRYTRRQWARHRHPAERRGRLRDDPAG